MQSDDLEFATVRVYNQLISVAVYTHQALHTDLQAGFFENLPFAGLRRGLTWLHPAARKTPLPVVLATGEQDMALLVEDRCRTTQPQFALFAKSFPINNFCHFIIPLLIKISSRSE